MVAGKSLTVLTQRQKSQIENIIYFLIDYTYKSESLDVKTFIYIDKTIWLVFKSPFNFYSCAFIAIT